MVCATSRIASGPIGNSCGCSNPGGNLPCSSSAIPAGAGSGDSMTGTAGSCCLGWGLDQRDPGAYSYLPESIRAFPEQEALARELEQAGFEKVTWKNLTGGIAALHLGVDPPSRLKAIP